MKKQFLFILIFIFIITLPGPKAAEIIKRREESMPAAIKCIYPCVIAKGEGAMFEDVDGNVFLDWINGLVRLGQTRCWPSSTRPERTRFYYF